MAKPVVKTKAELEKQLSEMKLNLNNPKITSNPMALGGLKKRISDLEAKIKNFKEDAAPAAKKAAPAKVAAVKKEKVEKPAKEKKAPAPKKEKVSISGFKIGDTVTWEQRGTGKKLTGTIKNIRFYKGDKNKPLLDVKDKDGNAYCPSPNKVTKK